MRIETKRALWGLVVGLFILGPCFYFLVDHRGYKDPDGFKEIVPNIADAILYGKEDDLDEDASAYERLMSYNLLTPPEEKEETAEDKAEAKRLANWKANFPYKPTTDPDLVMTEETIKFSNPSSPAGIHGFLKEFFQNEARFTSQFEQLYHILEEHGRGDNPVAAGQIFNSLWEYHYYSQKDPDESSGVYSFRLGRHVTNAEEAECCFESIVYELHAERRWPDLEFMPEAEAMAIRDRIVNEIEGMDEIPESFFVYKDDIDLEVGDSPLVISPGWQAAYDEWDRRWLEIESRERQNRLMNVGEGNILMANDRPVISAEGDGFAAYITAPDGYRVPLSRGDNGKVIIPTPSQIEEMKANGEGEWVELPERTAPPTPQLTEEEWKMQEALRMLEEAARQQE